ncbi:amino acid adenylation domain-containing protein [Streptomyces sp. CAU 1734]|uniref:non-ribosomal peptide synthetase n=1 Tax=Streptomyces sp. CAU 1734 TaxID=3140360 RepID=UPI003261AF15
MFPLSFAQRRLWFLNRLHGADSTYHLPAALRLHGSLDESALEKALGDVVARHEALRTVFPERDGEPAQLILEPDPSRPGLSVVSVTAEGLAEAVRAAIAAPFSIGHEPPLRAVLFRPFGAKPLLVLVMHHIVADGWSLTVLLDDLATAYRERTAGPGPPTWTELPVQYADYTLWQRELLGDPADPGSVHARQLAYWRAALEGAPAALTLPSDRPRPPVAGHRAEAVKVCWGAERHRALIALARRYDCTLFMVVHAALAALLFRLGAGTDIPVGTVVAGRTEEDLDGVIGMFVNTLVPRVDLAGHPSYAQLLRRVREADLAAYAHQDLPFELLVEAVNPPRSLAHHPLFQVLLAFGNTALPAPDFGGVRAVPEDAELPGAKVDLTFQLTEHHGAGGVPGGVRGVLEYATELYDRSTAESLVARLTRILDAATTAPDTLVARIGILSDAEQSGLLAERAASARRLPPTTLHEVFIDQARRTPEADAVICGQQRYTYREVDERSARLAELLRQAGVRAGSLVAVALPRSPSLVISLLAVLRAGGAYLPLELGQPDARLAEMLDDAQPICLVTDESSRGELSLADGPTVVVDQAGHSHFQPIQHCGPATDSAPGIHHPAYVIYTSGSTGRPKGVVIPHRAIDNRLRWMQGSFPLGPGDRVLQKTPFGFDVSVWEFFWPLRVGAALVLAAPDEHRDPVQLARTIREQRVTVAHFVPSMLREFLGEPSVPISCAGLRRVFCSGEALGRETAAEFHRLLPGVSLENLYGPTEAAVDVTHHPCLPGDRGTVPIGRPVWNTRIHVLDAGFALCPVGVPGELYLAGAQLADGYLGRPALTAARFAADPYGPPGTRMYRTGDIVRRRPDGALDFLGRDDGQVKLRGRRVEVGEVEAVLAAQDGVAAACAMVREYGPGDQRLLVYAARDPRERAPEPALLRQALAERLPAALVPSVVTVLDRFPLTANGKLDRTALHDPRPAARGGARPRTPLEALLAQTFADVLGVPCVGADDDFFAQGGHSLLAVPLLRIIRRTLGMDVPLPSLFRWPTPATLARSLAGAQPTQDMYGVLLELRAQGVGAPLFMVHPGTGLSWCYFRLLQYIDPTRPVYGLQGRGIATPGDPAVTLPGSVDEMAEDYLAEIRKVQATGPYHLLGWSYGGCVAHAMATRLRRSGEAVDLLVLLDSHPPLPATLSRPMDPSGPAEEKNLMAEAVHNLLGGPFEGSGHPETEFGPNGDLNRIREGFPPLADAGTEQIRSVLNVGINNLRLQREFVPDVFDGNLTLITADLPGAGAPAWRPYTTGEISEHRASCDHHSMLTTGAATTGALLSAVLQSIAPPTPREPV